MEAWVSRATVAKRGPVNPRPARQASRSRDARCLNFDNHRFDRTIERTNELSRDLFSRLVSSSVSWTIFDSFHRIGLNLLGFKVRL